MPGGTTIEILVPSPDDTDSDGCHAYRVRGADGVTEFPTLPDVARHLFDARAPALENELLAPVAAESTPEQEPSPPAPTSGPSSRHLPDQSPSAEPRGTSER